MSAKRRRKRARQNKRARKQTKPAGLWGRVISPIKVVVAGVLFLGGLAVWITDLTASVVEIAGLSLDYYSVEPEVVASEINPRDPFSLPFTIKIIPLGIHCIMSTQFACLMQRQTAMK